jgi:hypothetical protein
MLSRKSRGSGAVLAYRGHLLTENRNGLVVSTLTTRAYGSAERDAALLMAEGLPEMKRNRNSLVGALIHAIITIRMVILIFLAVLAFFVRFPPTFLGSSRSGPAVLGVSDRQGLESIPTCQLLKKSFPRNSQK